MRGSLLCRLLGTHMAQWAVSHGPNYSISWGGFVVPLPACQRLTQLMCLSSQPCPGLCAGSRARRQVREWQPPDEASLARLPPGGGNVTDCSDMAQWKVSQVGHTTLRVLPGAL